MKPRRILHEKNTTISRGLAGVTYEFSVKMKARRILHFSAVGGRTEEGVHIRRYAATQDLGLGWGGVGWGDDRVLLRYMLLHTCPMFKVLRNGLLRYILHTCPHVM